MILTISKMFNLTKCELAKALSLWSDSGKSLS